MLAPPSPKRVAIGLGSVFAVPGVLLGGGYTLHWGWTGCGGKTFRDWLSLLITPFILPMACKWFVASQHAAASVTTARE